MNLAGRGCERSFFFIRNRNIAGRNLRGFFFFFFRFTIEPKYLQNEIPLRNELFGKGRMAYVVELDDEASDVPTTLLRLVFGRERCARRAGFERDGEGRRRC